MRLEEVKIPEKQLKRGTRSSKYFLTQLDMAFIKRDQAILNSMQKRGECKRSNHTGICICGCGAPGCHFEFNMQR